MTGHKPVRISHAGREKQQSMEVLRFSTGPPQRYHEPNEWGDNFVHDVLQGIERRRRLVVLCSNKDFECEWDYDWRNKRLLRQGNTKVAVNVVIS
jgi:hypothetical protein